MYFVHQQFLNRIDGNVFNGLKGERVNKQFPRLLIIESAAFEIKNLILFQLSNGSPMRTNNIVGKYLELGLGIDQPFAGKQKISVFLEGINFLCILADKNLAVKHRMSVPVDYAFMQLV